jgi:hypothetical protein
LSFPAGSVVNRTSEIASVMIRLISSGMVRSPLRRPASTCAMGTPRRTAVRAAATVEVTSPTTTTQSGFRSSSTGSSRRMTSAVWPTAVSARASRFTSGAGISRLAKNDSDI